MWLGRERFHKVKIDRGIGVKRGQCGDFFERHKDIITKRYNKVVCHISFVRNHYFVLCIFIFFLYFDFFDLS